MTRTFSFPWLIAAIGLAGSALGWVLEPARFHAAWLAALVAWLGWPLGSLALLLTHALTGGRWGEAIRPALLAGIATLPLLLPAVVPLAVGLPILYPWARPDAHFSNAFYLNVPFFAGRGIVYLVVWFGLAGLVMRALRRGQPLRGLAPAGLLALAVTVTFAAIDTTLSLSPGFNSSIFGMIAANGAGLAALAIATLLAAASAERAVLDDLGKLLLALVILAAYLDFMQFLIVWQSDLPNEAIWYVQRARGVWAEMAATLGVGRFLLPFVALIFGPVRRSRLALSVVAGWLVLMEIARAWWLVLPSAARGLSWIDVAAVLAFAGTATALFARERRREPQHV